MDELRAAESIRYLANQYSNMVFVAEQLEKIGSLKAQVDSLSLQHVEAQRDLEQIRLKIQADQKQAEDERQLHEQSTKQLAEAYAEKRLQLEEDLLERSVQQEAELANRVKAAEQEMQLARDAHQTHMAELNGQLVALGERVAQATAEAVAAEDGRDRTQKALNALKASIASIKINGAAE